MRQDRFGDRAIELELERRLCEQAVLFVVRQVLDARQPAADRLALAIE